MDILLKYSGVREICENNFTKLLLLLLDKHKQRIRTWLIKDDAKKAVVVLILVVLRKLMIIITTI